MEMGLYSGTVHVPTGGIEMSDLTDREKRMNVLKTRIQINISDIEDLKSEIYDYEAELLELEDMEDD